MTQPKSTQDKDDGLYNNILVKPRCTNQWLQIMKEIMTISLIILVKSKALLMIWLYILYE